MDLNAWENHLAPLLGPAEALTNGAAAVSLLSESAAGGSATAWIARKLSVVMTPCVRPLDIWTLHALD